jgi:hypothetical protein
VQAEVRRVGYIFGAGPEVRFGEVGPEIMERIFWTARTRAEVHF